MYLLTKVSDKLTVLDCDIDEYIKIIRILKPLHHCEDTFKCKNGCQYYSIMMKEGGVDRIVRGTDTRALFNAYKIDTMSVTVNQCDAQVLVNSLPPDSVELVFSSAVC